MKGKPATGSKRKGLTPGVTVLSFEPGCYFEFTELGVALPKHVEANHAKPSNGNGAAKKKASVTDRRYLKDIEIFLNNCVNLAERLEDKRAIKVVQLLREARELAIHVRG